MAATSVAVGENNVAHEFPQTLQKTSSQEVSRTGKELFQFSQTLQKTMASSVPEDRRAERAQWVLNAPEPPGLWSKLHNFINENIFPKKYKSQTPKDRRLFKILKNVFPIFSWGKSYNVKMFRNDVLAGLTLASLCIPQVC